MTYLDIAEGNTYKRKSGNKVFLVTSIKNIRCPIQHIDILTVFFKNINSDKVKKLPIVEFIKHFKENSNGTL